MDKESILAIPVSSGKSWRKSSSSPVVLCDAFETKHPFWYPDEIHPSFA